MSRNPGSSITARKALSIVLVLMGAAFVSTSPLKLSHASPSPIPPKLPTEYALGSFEPLAMVDRKELVGNVCALGASLLHALYTVALLEKLRDKPSADPLALFACIGAASVVFFGPGLALLDWLGWESFQLIPKGMPSDSCHVWAVLLVRSILYHAQCFLAD